jgi:hypothetical protein
LLSQQINHGYTSHKTEQELLIELYPDEEDNILIQLMNSCKLNCFNQGVCEYDYDQQDFTCLCQNDYSFTSNCLLNIDEFGKELFLRETIIQSKNTIRFLM